MLPTDFLDNLHAPLPQLLMQLIVIVVVARVIGKLFAKIGQPVVVGEMFAGIALGPSLLGVVAPDISHFIFPTYSFENLQLLSQVGIILFMFVVGMELDVRLLRQRAATATVVSSASMLLPFLLGLWFARSTYPAYAGPRGAFLPFALFMGICLSVTAFPVLARILRERNLIQTDLGSTALTSAAIGDAVAWCALAFIAAISRAESLESSISILVVLGVLLVFAFAIVRPLFEIWIAKWQVEHGALRGPVVPAFVCAFLFALCTETIGIHALFGAFIAGVAMPKRHDFTNYITERLETFSTLFLLPVFFAFTGLRTQIGGLGSDWIAFILILLIAVAGKFGGSAIAARAAGMRWRESLALGALMNTRGLMELIAVNLGLDLGVFSPKMFTMLVLMALVTTFTTGPVVSLLGYGQRSSAQPA